MWVDAKTFYMDHDSHPKVGDYIYQVGWDGNRPRDLKHTYRINDVYPVRGDNGRIEYWTVAAKSEITNMDTQSIVIRSLGGIQNYEMIRK